MNLNARARMDILEIPLQIVGHVSFHNDHYNIVNLTLVLYNATLIIRLYNSDKSLVNSTMTFKEYVSLFL